MNDTINSLGEKLPRQKKGLNAITSIVSDGFETAGAQTIHFSNATFSAGKQATQAIKSFGGSFFSVLKSTTASLVSNLSDPSESSTVLKKTQKFTPMSPTVIRELPKFSLSTYPADAIQARSKSVPEANDNEHISLIKPEFHLPTELRLGARLLAVQEKHTNKVDYTVKQEINASIISMADEEDLANESNFHEDSSMDLIVGDVKDNQALKEVLSHSSPHSPEKNDLIETYPETEDDDDTLLIRAVISIKGSNYDLIMTATDTAESAVENFLETIPVKDDRYKNALISFLEETEADAETFPLQVSADMGALLLTA